jgi:hypothetical protein
MHCSRTAVVGCVAFDFDGDGDIDQTDFGTLQRCYSGEDRPANQNWANRVRGRVPFAA